MWLLYYCAFLYEECTKPHGHMGNLGVTPGICGDVGERAQLIMKWVKAPCVRNGSHSRRLRVTKVRSWAMSSLWHPDFRILKISSIGGAN